VSMKVLLAHDGDDWARKCWFARGMSGHEVAGPHKGMFYPSSAGTLPCVQSLEMFVSAFVALYLNDTQ
jgi:hypothetical protein